MTIWSPNLDGIPGPRYRALAEAITATIVRGELQAGDRLPPQRDLAYALGLSLNTISRAYTELQERGLVGGEIGRGTYVRGPEAAPAAPAPGHMHRASEGKIDFSQNLPCPGAARAELACVLATLSHQPTLDFLLDHERGEEGVRHRRAGACWLNALGADVSTESVCITNGAQHGLFSSLIALSKPGDTLLVESLTYAPIKQMARRLGLKLVPVAMDRGGLDPEALDRACRTHAPAILYTMPTLQTPTTITMDVGRRLDIAALAGRHDLTIIEDDVYGHLPAQRPATVASFVPDRTVLLTSVSKAMAPGLRVGYLSAPPRIRDAIRASIAINCWMPPPLMAEIVARFIEDGAGERLRIAQRSEIAGRQQIVAATLGTHVASADRSGLHLWLGLPENWPAHRFVAEAEARGVRIGGAEIFAIEQKAAPNAVRLCIGHEADRTRVIRGLRILGEILGSEDRTDNLVI